MVAIAMFFWVDSRYPALMKRYNAGTQVKANGALTFGAVYPVDRSMPYLTRVWRTTVNWLDANRVRHDVLISVWPGRAGISLSTLRRRRTKSRYLNTLIGAAAGVPLGVCSNCIAPHRAGTLRFRDGHGICAGRHVRLARPQPGCAGNDLRVVPIASCVYSNWERSCSSFWFSFRLSLPARASPSSPFNFAVEIPSNETWGQALTNTTRSYARSFWTVFRVAFPLMILAAVLGAFAVELLPQQALSGSVTLIGIIAVALVSAFLPVPMAFDVAIAYILMTKGVPLPYVAAILCTLGIVSVYSLAVVGRSISWRIAGATYSVVVVLGIMAGLAVRIFG